VSKRYSPQLQTDNISITFPQMRIITFHCCFEEESIHNLFSPSDVSCSGILTITKKHIGISNNSSDRVLHIYGLTDLCMHLCTYVCMYLCMYSHAHVAYIILHIFAYVFMYV
jgi:hypothetical protein